MTGLTSNIDDLIKQLQKVAQTDIDVSEAFLVGVNAAKGLMQNRIFNKGMDAAGKPFGKYKGKASNSLSKAQEKRLFKDEKTKARNLGTQGLFTPYELKRVMAGRQIVYKDLEFAGDLRRGILTIKDGPRKVVCAIPNEKLYLIAKGQEQQLKTKIFYLSANEREVMLTNIQAAIKQQYVRAINTK